jgi:hypothetical protein
MRWHKGSTGVIGCKVLACGAAAALAWAGFASSGLSSVSVPHADRVVIISVPGLRWQDLAALDTPGLDRDLSAAAMLSVRSIGSETSVLEGYLALNAGNRIEIAPPSPVSLRPVPSNTGRPGSACLPHVVADATTSANDDLNGAHPGALGSALAEQGIATAVFGESRAIAGLMDASGCVGRFGAIADLASLPDLFGIGTVTMLEYAGLESTNVASERTSIIDAIDASVANLDLATDTQVIVVAPAAVNDAAEVTVVGLRSGAGGAEIASTPLVSASTRRAGYVTLTDIAPTVLQVLGIDVPAAMSGTTMTLVAASDAAGAPGSAAAFADVAERVKFRDRAVGPVSVAFVALVVLCALSVLVRRARLARSLAAVIMVYPTLTYLSGLVAYHRLPLSFYVVIILTGSVVIAAAATSLVGRFGAWAATTVLAAALWLTLGVDVVTGGALQINTPFGYTPTIAGRFQGLGNVAFGFVASAAMIVAVLGLLVLRADSAAGMSRRVWWSVWLAGWTGVVTIVAVAAPTFGSDVGGTLAVVPAFGLLVLSATGRRVGWRRALLAVGAGVAAMVALAAIDYARDPAAQTHLGRFVGDLLHGDGPLVLRRKLRGNIAILTSSVWSVLLVIVIVVGVTWCSRHRSMLQSAMAARPYARVFLVGWGTAAVLGFALNDSGIAIPAVMGSIALAWLVGAVVPVRKRVPR